MKRNSSHTKYLLHLGNVIIIFCLFWLSFLLYAKFAMDKVETWILQQFGSDPKNTYAYEQRVLVGEVSGIPIFRTKDIELSSDILPELEKTTAKLPDIYHQHKPEAIVFVGTEYLNLESEIEKVSTSGGFASDSIYISEPTIKAIESRPILGLDFLEMVIAHEWMHIIQYDEFENGSKYTQLLKRFTTPHLHSTFSVSFAQNVGWKTKPLFSSAVIVNLAEDHESQHQTNYGKSSWIEDMAETSRYFLAGQPHFFSEARLDWVEQFTQTKQSTYSNGVFPLFNAPEITRSSYLELKPGVDYKIETSEVENDSFREKYFFVSLSVYIVPSNFTLQKFDQTLSDRGFFITYSENCTAYAPCTDEQAKRTYYQFDQEYLVFRRDNRLVILHGSNRTRFLQISDIFTNENSL